MLSSDKSLSKIDSIILAEYITYRLGAVSHLKLQKLLYYVQAYHLAYFNEPIIDDDFEAWVHGPVSRKIYNSLKDHSILHTELKFTRGPGEELPDRKISALTSEQLNLVDDVIKEFGPLSGLELENLSHNEKPWINARAGHGVAEKCSNVIDKETMKVFYRDQIYGQTEA